MAHIGPPKSVCANVWTAQAFELAALKQGNLASSGLGGMAGCAVSLELSSLGFLPKFPCYQGMEQGMFRNPAHMGHRGPASAKRIQ
jgi:hypothetical protein